MRKNPESGLSSKRAHQIPELAPYTNPNHQSSLKTLLLPVEYSKKISQPEYQKVRQAYFIEADSKLKLNRQSFQTVIRSLGIVVKTYSLIKVFEENLKKKEMNWEQFLGYYVQFRNQKGSYNQLSGALGSLDKEYAGNWNQLLIDLGEIGDVLTPKQMQKFKQVVMGGKTLTHDNILNALLGYQ